jgi:hypothetical protein
LIRPACGYLLIERPFEQGGTVAENHDVTQRPERPTEQWVTGDEPMTGPQQSYLSTLAQEAGEDVPDDLTKAQASEQIERLQSATGRGR